jgi:hypothetical protein
MYSQMLRAFTKNNPISTEFPLVKVSLQIKGMTPKVKVIVLNRTQNKSETKTTLT